MLSEPLSQVLSETLKREKIPKEARKSVLEDNLPLSDRRRPEKTATDEGSVLPEAASPEREEAVS